MEEISDEIKIKIKEKMLGMFYVRSLEKLDPNITVPEFKFILGIFRIKKKNWYALAKEMERDNVIELYRNFKGIKVLRSGVKG